MDDLVNGWGSSLFDIFRGLHPIRKMDVKVGRRAGCAGKEEEKTPL
jgi:hypothetical protein